MGPDGQPRLSLPRTPGSTVPQCDTSFIGSICALISASFSVGRSFGTPFLWSGCLGWVSPTLASRVRKRPGSFLIGSHYHGSNYYCTTITPIAHGEVLQRAPPTIGVCRSTFPFPFHDTCMRICKRAPPHCAVPMRICMTGTLPAITTDESI